MGLRDTHLPPPGFDHEFTGQVRRWLWLQGANDNALVQRITRNDLKGKGVSDSPGRPPGPLGLAAGLFSRKLERSVMI